MIQMKLRSLSIKSLNSDSHLPKIFCYLLNLKSFENDEKYFLFHLKIFHLKILDLKIFRYFILRYFILRYYILRYFIHLKIFHLKIFRSQDI